MKPGDPLAIETLFNDIAPDYDRLNDLLSLGLHRFWKRQLLSWLAPVSGEKWLDVCCGTGDLALILANKVCPDGTVVGVDSAIGTLALANKRMKERFSKSLTFIHGDALDTGLPSNHFDGAVMAYGLRNLSDPQQGLKELHRVLKPGARAGILDFNQLEDDSIGAKFQKLYLRKVVVPIAGKAGLRDHYAYLENSLKSFPKGTIQEQLAIKAGFKMARHKLLALGQMGALILRA